MYVHTVSVLTSSAKLSIDYSICGSVAKYIIELVSKSLNYCSIAFMLQIST